MLGIIGAVAATAVGGVLAYAVTRPDSFRVERSAIVAAPSETVFALLNDFHQWLRWSPWEKLDPEMNRTHSGAERGKGAVYAWSGNKKVGSGRMEILESQSPSRVKIQLDFLTPFEAHNVTTFTLEPVAGGTRVHWQMEGPHTFMTKVMCVFVSMDKMVGKDFEAGLANLQREATA
jgi:uncharacterized protein YndB with AHSA1/START domain